MPLNCSINKVLVIGSGPIVIGQAGEFDYSGTQACLALKEEGCQVVLLNSNPATIMTDSNVADAIYIEPIIPSVIEKIIRKERPEALLPTMGGQTALNCTKEIAELGILKKYDVRLLGLTLETLEKSENRELFKEEMERIGIEVPKSFAAASWDEAMFAQKKLGFPVVIRSSFTLGGQGGGVAYDLEEFKQLCEEGFSFSKKILIEESLYGWKEFELEVMRDQRGNCIVICGIENIDPMGVHTGDSITVCPIQTLTDKEYQLMRKKAFYILEAIGMVCGGCNVQFAVEPTTGRMLCIEVNPRVSRSSALVAKATGYPIAKIAAKMALGYHLDELREQAFFEPAIDYVVTKIPYFNFDKFPRAHQGLSTHMKSVGEVMAIGRTFRESLNKALSSLDKINKTMCPPLEMPHPDRLQTIRKAFQSAMSIDEVQRSTHCDPWFLSQIHELVKEEKSIAHSSLELIDFRRLHRWKQLGFSDANLADLLKCRQHEISSKRKALQVHPVYKRIDTCSGEFPREIPFLYSTYEEECESAPSKNKKVVVVGGGANRIGQGIEFDYCSVHALKAIRDLGYESIMINCNPETVSTDDGVADRMYFEPLTVEHILEVIRMEKPMGILLQFGGQTSLNFAKSLHEAGAALLGTSMASIDLAEDREKFRRFAQRMGIKQPRNESFSSTEEALPMAKKIGFPMILRPSYVIGGDAMRILDHECDLKRYLQEERLEDSAPILMEEFLEGAMEVELDAIGDGKEVFICGIVEHVEPTGVHSGDSMSFLSPYKLNTTLQKKLIRSTRAIGRALEVTGLFNVQFAVYKNQIFVLEINPRASRTIPLLSKTTGLALVQIATKCILGQSLKEQDLEGQAIPKCLGLKLPVFPFSRLGILDEKLGPQMQSTGEVLCIGKTFGELFVKAKLYAQHLEKLLTKDLEAKLSFPNLSPEWEVYDIRSIHSFF